MAEESDEIIIVSESEESEVDEKASVGYVYKISSPYIDKIYIGSTVKTLRERFSQHKRTKDTRSKIIIDFGDARITLIEEVKFDDILELRQRENYHMALHKDIVVNNRRAPTGLTRKEVQKAYYEENKDKISAKHKAWNEANKDKISAKKKAWKEANKDRVKATYKTWSEANKDRIKAKRTAKDTCECGSIISHNVMSRHRGTDKHARLLAEKLKNLSIE